jgi:Fuc2NAc and GlcNAc transferase
MPSVALLLAISALAASALVTGFVRRLAAGSGVLDLPNPRSSHAVPKPRGGGLAIVLVTMTGLLVLALRGFVARDLACALVGAASPWRWSAWPTTAARYPPPPD